MTLPTKMKAGVLRGNGDLALEERPVPTVKDGEMLIKVQACAICGSDVRIYNDGNPRITEPRIIGHEIAGEVCSLGDGVKGFEIGDRVAIGADVPCGNCPACKAGRGNCCDVNLAIGYQIDGGFSEYLHLSSQVVELGPVRRFGANLDYASAAIAEPLGCCLNGYEKIRMEKGCSVAIFGAGPVGVLLAHLGKALGASRVILIDPASDRLEQAASLGFSEILNPSDGDIVSTVREMTNGKGIDRVFTACPVRETHPQALAITATSGVINLFGGLPQSAPPVELKTNLIHYGEITMTGSHGATPEHHRKALSLIEDGSVDVSKLISRTFPLTDINGALKAAMSREHLKVVVKPHE